MSNVEILNLDPIACYSIGQNRIVGQIQMRPATKRTLFKRTQDDDICSFVGELNIRKNQLWHNVLFFKYEKRFKLGQLNTIDFEFPCHDMYLPSSFRFGNPKSTGVEVSYRIETSKNTWELNYQGKTMEYFGLDSDFLWYDIPVGRLAIKKYFNICEPLETQIQIITEKGKVSTIQLKLDAKVTSTAGGLQTVDRHSEVFETIDWMNQKELTLMELHKSPILCDCSILGVYAVETAISAMVGLEGIGEELWVHTGAKFDYLIEERTPPSYFNNEKAEKEKLTDHLQPPAPASPQLQSQVNLHEQSQQNHGQLPDYDLEQPPSAPPPAYKDQW